MTGYERVDYELILSSLSLTGSTAGWVGATALAGSSHSELGEMGVGVGSGVGAGAGAGAGFSTD